MNEIHRFSHPEPKGPIPGQRPHNARVGPQQTGAEGIPPSGPGDPTQGHRDPKKPSQWREVLTGGVIVFLGLPILPMLVVVPAAYIPFINADWVMDQLLHVGTVAGWLMLAFMATCGLWIFPLTRHWGRKLLPLWAIPFAALGRLVLRIVEAGISKTAKEIKQQTRKNEVKKEMVQNVEDRPDSIR